MIAFNGTPFAKVLTDKGIVPGIKVDTGAKDTVNRIFTDYFNFTNFELKYDIKPSDIRAELGKGNLVVVPVNGKALKNNNFRSQRRIKNPSGFHS